MLVRSAVCAMMLCLCVVSTPSPAKAENKCDLRVVPDPPDANVWGGVEVDPWIVSGQNGRCEATRLAHPIAGCGLRLVFDHGWQDFGCQELHIGGSWGSRADVDDAANMAAARRLGLPEHRELREVWLAPVDTEYLRSSDIRDEDFFERYPRRFTKIGAKTVRPNPRFRVATQSLHYVRMDGEEIAAVTGEAALGCLKIFFISWVAPDAAEAVEARLAEFLQDLRLEPVNLTDGQRTRVCSTGNNR